MNKKLIKKYKKELEGWGFVFSSNNLPYSKDISLMPNGNVCHYSGLRSTESYMD
tara:strand:- start:662 stop:823 length:162 start_codon:yes stop_codon:yes gene_type:complete